MADTPVSSDASTSPAHENALHTGELFEAIMLELFPDGLATLLRCSQVCKNWQDQIRASANIRRALFIRRHKAPRALWYIDIENQLIRFATSKDHPYQRGGGIRHVRRPMMFNPMLFDVSPLWTSHFPVYGLQKRWLPMPNDDEHFAGWKTRFEVVTSSSREAVDAISGEQHTNDFFSQIKDESSHRLRGVATMRFNPLHIKTGWSCQDMLLTDPPTSQVKIWFKLRKPKRDKLQGLMPYPTHQDYDLLQVRNGDGRGIRVRDIVDQLKGLLE